MMAQGMRTLTGAGTTADAWRRFFEPSDVVGIKVNCGGYPHCVSAYEIVAEVVRQLMGIGVPVSQIYVYERFQNQLDEVNYAPHLPEGVQIVAAERANRNVDNSGYDPATYLEADLFGEEDTRSNMMRLVSHRLTKIINIPNMKDHGATGVTGCLKNIAYGSFSNVARTHSRGKSHTYSVVGTLAAIEPLRSRTVLQIMDGLRGVWHGGPFARTTRYVFYPRQIMFGTDPVAIDRLLLDIIENERRAHGAISIWDRSPASLKIDDTRARDADPNVNIIIREPGHVEYASTLGLGVRVANEDQGAGRHGMTALLLLALSLPCVYWTQGIESRAMLEAAGIKRICVAPERADAWRAAGFTVTPLTEAELASREALASPGITPRAGTRLADPQPVDCGKRLALHETSGNEIRLRRPGRKGGARGGGSLCLWRGRGAQDRSCGPGKPRRDADVPGGAAGRRSAGGVGLRDCGRWVGDDGRGDESARPPQPPVPGGPGAVPAISAQHQDRDSRIPARGRRRSQRLCAEDPASAHGRAASACESTEARSSSAASRAMPGGRACI